MMKHLVLIYIVLILSGAVSPSFAQERRTLINDYFRLKDTLSERYGLDAGFKYSVIHQQRLGTALGENNYNLNGQFDFYGNWKLFGGNGTFTWLYMHIHQLGGITTTAFGEKNGNITPINDSDPNALLRFLMYRHKLFDGVLELMGGKFEPLLLFAGNRYAADDRVTFMSAPLGGPGAKDRTFSSLGGAIIVNPLDWLSLAWSFNSLEYNTGIPKAVFDNGEFYTLINATFTSQIQSLGEGIYRVTWVYTAAQEEDPVNGNPAYPESNGLIFSADQDLGDHWAAFLRYDNTDIQTRFSAINESVAGGFALRSPFNRQRDRVSAGLFHVKSEQQGNESETGFEVFYRLGWTEQIDLTFDLQGFWPSRASDFFLVGGIRLMVRL